MRILVAEENAPLAEHLRTYLQREQFSVHLVSDAAETQRLASDQPFDILVLDLNFPASVGLEFLSHIHTKRPDLPVLAVTAPDRVEDRVRLLNAGVDDCLAKPFAFAELAARVRAILRRGNSSELGVLRVDDLEIDRVAHDVHRAGRAIELSPREFALLEFLMRHEGQPVTRNAIVEQVWKLRFNGMTNVVDVYINYLRRKVDSGHDRPLIRTVRGVGYQIGRNGARL
jgi:DNA-binding response OmpR family regulator